MTHASPNPIPVLAGILAAGLSMAVPATAPAYQPMIVPSIIYTNEDPEEGAQETTGTLARLDGSVYVCSWGAEGWTVTEYEPSRYSIETGGVVRALDVSRTEDSTLIAQAVMDSPYGPPMSAPETRGNTEYVVFVGRIELLDDEESTVLDTVGTYLIAGEGRVMFTRNE